MSGRKKVLFVDREEADQVAASRGDAVIEVDFNVYSTGNVKAAFFVGDETGYQDFKARRLASIAKKPSLKNWAKNKERQSWYATFYAANNNFTAQFLADFLCEKLPTCSTYSYGLATRQIKVWIGEGKLQNYFEGKTSLYRKIP